MVAFAQECGRELGMELKTGTYAYFHLPNFETPTDVQILRQIGATTVGASTIPEHAAARAVGMKNICLSLVTNMGCGLSDQVLDGYEVLEEGKKALVRIGAHVSKIIEKFELGEVEKLPFFGHETINMQTSETEIDEQKLIEEFLKEIKDTGFS